MDKNKITVSFHNVDTSDALKEVIISKLERLIKMHGNYLTRVDYTLSMENPKESSNPEQFKSSLHLHGKMKKEFHFDVTDKNPRSTVTSVVNKAINALKKDY